MDTNVGHAMKITGGILIAVLIITLLSWFFQKVSPVKQQENDIKATEQLEEFNREFEVYNKKLMYGTDILSVLGKAASNNIHYNEEYPNSDYDDLYGHYMVDIEVNLIYDIYSYLEVYKTEIYKGVVKTKPINDFSEVPDEVKNKLSIGTRTDLKQIEFSNGEYSLCNRNGITDSDNKYKKYRYMKQDIVDKFLINAVDLIKTIENTNSATQNTWSKAIYKTAAYDLKTKKFKCTGVEYDAKDTGRIIKMSFSEIQL